MGVTSTIAGPAWNSTMRRGSQPSAFNPLSVDGFEYYSGTDVRIFFDDIEVSELDSVGFQMTQNVRPVYGYHSHVFNQIQYGTKLVQGYFQTHLSSSAYVTAILASIELERRKSRGGDLGIPKNSITAPMAVKLGQTLDQAIALVGLAQGPDAMKQIGDAYMNQYLPTVSNEPASNSAPGGSGVRGLFPPEPCGNFFTFNPAGSSLADRGFTLTVVYGNTVFGPKAVLINGQLQTDAGESYPGTFRRLYEVHLIAGPNSQVVTDGKPIAELYTFICKDLS